MEIDDCNVIYVDRTVSQDRCVQAYSKGSNEDAVIGEPAHVVANMSQLLKCFSEVYLCNTGGACLTQLLNLQDKFKPTLILIDTSLQDPLLERPRSRDASPHAAVESEGEDHESELYGLALLKRIKTESELRNLPQLVVPVVVILPQTSPSNSSNGTDNVMEALPRRLRKRCMELGASDVMASPLVSSTVASLDAYVFRARQEARKDHTPLALHEGRGNSWNGVPVEKPRPSISEDIVYNLMCELCPGKSTEIHGSDFVHRGMGSNLPERLGNSDIIRRSVEKEAEIASAVARWHFCAHSFDNDELVIAAAVMIQHALSMPELDEWRIPTGQLHQFILACRAAYNDHVSYHNFRHVVDVLHATFNFLINLGALPPYPLTDRTLTIPPKSPETLLLKPFEALTLLVTALGHDVGHPGYNNGFLKSIKAPIAQLYNDRSILENFHCASYTQILRRHWPAIYQNDKMRDLMIYSILATDMAEHFNFMEELKKLLVDLETKSKIPIIKNPKKLICALLIKCADISNVAREHATAVRWMEILSDEFMSQASTESDLKIATALHAPPTKDPIALSKNQLFFMKGFAEPLFEGVARILPAMQYLLDETLLNKAKFQQFVDDEEAKQKGNLSSGLFAGREQKFEVVSSVGVSEIVEPAVSRQLNGDYTIAPKKRCSEATEESSVPCSTEWVSQAASATTGKMPLSPSTQGTSIISTDSLDRPNSVPVTTITAPGSAKSQSELRIERQQSAGSSKYDAVATNYANGSQSVNGVVGIVVSAEPCPDRLTEGGKALKKKRSWWTKFTSRNHT